jgi:cyclase
MSRRPEFREGFTQIASQVWAYLQPGGLGFSNAGLLAPRAARSADGALLIDTFFDLPHTHRLLDAIARDVGAPIRRVVNTHYNGDHCWGNQLVRGAEIIGHRSVPADMAKVPPAGLQALKSAPDSLAAARGLREALAPWDFDGIELTPPTTLVDDEMELEVDGLSVRLIHVGPAHTTGDVIAHLPGEGIVFTGDVLFRLCTPIGWEGTFANWIAALERIAALGVDTVVPGHGPVCGVEGLLEMRDYLAYVRTESRRHFDAGRTIEDAAARIELGPYAGWLEPERIVFQIDRAYREFRGEPFDAPVDFMRLTSAMATLVANGSAGGSTRPA